MKTHLARALTMLALLGAASASATTLVRADVPALTQIADSVVRGTVARISTRWSGDHMRILTDVEIRVQEVMKGQALRSLIVVNPGGVIGDLGQRVAGTPEFSEGEEVILFLEQRGENFILSGMAQGKFKVERSSDGSAAFAVPTSTSEAVLLDPVTRQPVKGEHQPMALEAFKARVKDAVKAGLPLLPQRKTGP
jgi:hypothetical protein